MRSKKNTGIILLVVSVLFVTGVLVYREWIPGGGYGYGGHMMGGLGMGMGGLMLVYWGLILFGLILMINWLLNAGRNETDSPSCDAQEILKSRYARGDIDRTQFERMRKELSE